MKKYTTPVLDTIVLTKTDILAASDVLIDGSDLFGTNSDGE